MPRANTPLRFFAAVHYLVLAGRAPTYAAEPDPWPRFSSILEEHRDWLREFVTEQPVQTNEVGRCWTLLPGFLAAASASGAQTLDLIELGPSGGLNLLWDRYRYAYAQGGWGPVGAPLEHAGSERRPVPGALLTTQVDVRRRVGIDRRPVDATTEDGALLLQCFVWADQPERLERMRAAIEVARSEPPALIEGDYVELLPSLLADRDEGALTVVFDSHSTEYLEDERFERLVAAVEGEARSGPLAWVSSERPRGERGRPYMLELQSWPGGERRRLAEVHYHGAGLDWLG